MSLNRADELRRELEEKDGFTAEHANGTMKIVDEMVDNGFDRLDAETASLRSDMDVRFSAIDKRFDATDRLIVLTSALFPFTSAVVTVGLLVALESIFGVSPLSVLWQIETVYIVPRP